jgi:hypothetical protein
VIVLAHQPPRRRAPLSTTETAIAHRTSLWTFSSATNRRFGQVYNSWSPARPHGSSEERAILSSTTYSPNSLTSAQHASRYAARGGLLRSAVQTKPPSTRLPTIYVHLWRRNNNVLRTLEDRQRHTGTQVGL